VADAGTPDWWLDRLYKQLRERAPQIDEWDDWYSGDHPMPAGYEKASPLFERLYETTGLNMLQLVTDAGLDRMHIDGFKIAGEVSTDVWDVWQSNNFDLGAAQVLQEEKALSAAYALVDPVTKNADGLPTVTPEHPLQCITEDVPGQGTQAAYRMGLKVYVDDTGETPLRYAYLYGPERVEVYAAPTRQAFSRKDRAWNGWTVRPAWAHQPSLSGRNDLGECALVPFLNRVRMLKDPVPEFFPAIPTQRRIIKTLLDRMAMQDEGAFKAMWATGIKIPVDPATGKPVEPFRRAIDRMFVNENPDGKFGQFQAEDIKQMLEAVRDDIADAAIVVPTSPDQILGKLVNVSGDGLKLAQVSEIKRVRRSMRFDEESFELLARLMLKGAGKSVPKTSSMSTVWRNPEYRTEGEMSDAATKALTNGVPHEAVWERYYGATPDEAKDWAAKLQQRQSDPILAQILKDAQSGNANAGAGA
jgi:hypothetical protein